MNGFQQGVMMRLRRSGVLVVAAAAAVIVFNAPAQASVWPDASSGSRASAAGSSRASGDFDGDGNQDLAIGVPNEDDGSRSSSGGVHVLYGRNTGLVGADNEYIDQNTPGAGESVESGDLFGFSLAAGDFDADGNDDLAVGVPGEDIPAGSGSTDLSNVGIVQIFNGSDEGLLDDDEADDQILHQDQSGVPGGNEANDEWGTALAVGDFNGNDVDDLAIGVPEEAIKSDGVNRDAAGAVVALLGDEGDGIRTTRAVHLFQDVPNTQGGSETADHFGGSLAAGFFNSDARVDLAVGVSGEDINSAADAGAVHVFYGTRTNLSTPNNKLWHQDSPSIEDSIGSGELFGDALAAGDFDADGDDDLVAGVPRENEEDTDDGAIHVLFGARTGITSRGDLVVSQEQTDDEGEDDDQFGSVLNAIDNDGADVPDDLVVGVPLEDLDTDDANTSEDDDTGAAFYFVGSGDNTAFEEGVIFSRNNAEMDDGDSFGAAVSSGDYGAGVELAIGIPFDDSAEEDAGAIAIGAVEDFGDIDVFDSAALELTQDDLEDEEAEDDDHFASVAT